MTAKAASDPGKHSRKRRVHKRTILFVTLVVLLPWALLSIPGDFIGGGGFGRPYIGHFQHGWPFIHLHSTLYKDFENDRDSTDGNPDNIDAELRIAEAFDDFFRVPQRDSKLLEYDLRLSKSQSSEAGYWSTTWNWSIWDDEHYFEIRWLGLFVNLLLLSIVAVVVGLPIEKRIRNKKFFSFSLLSFGVVITLFCIALPWSLQTYNDFQSEREHAQKLTQLNKESFLAGTYIEYAERFPRAFSQLFNGGYTPWGDFEFFKKVSASTVDIYIDDLVDETEMNRVLESLETLDRKRFGLDITVVDYNELTERYLNKINEYRIVKLDLCFYGNDWFSERTGESFDGIPQEEALKKEAIGVNLDLSLTHMKDLTLRLEDCFSAKEQLEPFLNLPSPTNVRIENMNDEAAKFILETQDRWPDAPEFIWLESSLSPEWKEKMSQRFPRPKEYEGY